jgi:hypothetical protein
MLTGCNTMSSSSIIWSPKILFYNHYQNQSLCRVPEALGEALKHSAKALTSVTLGKEGSANSASAKPSLPSTFSRAQSTRHRKAAVTAPGDGDGGFAECLWWHSAKELSLPSVCPTALGKESIFAECHLGHAAKSPPGRVPMSGSLPSVLCGTRQSRPLCRVPMT